MTFIEASHVGFVVADLDVATAEFEDRLGVRWAAVQERHMPVSTADGVVRADFRFTYSTTTTGPMLIELIEGQEGTPWWPGAAEWAFHHVGFWSDELVADSQRLDEEGVPLQATGGEGPSPRGFAYHQLQHGPLIELVDAARRPLFPIWLAGWEFPQA